MIEHWIDLHQLPRDMFISPPEKTASVICLIDTCSRLAWTEVVISKKALPVMFKALKPNASGARSTRMSFNAWVLRRKLAQLMAY